MSTYVDVSLSVSNSQNKPVQSETTTSQPAFLKLPLSCSENVLHAVVTLYVTRLAKEVNACMYPFGAEVPLQTKVGSPHNNSHEDTFA